MISKHVDSKKAMTLGILYAVCVSLLGAYYNYIIPYNPMPDPAPNAAMIVLWLLLYLPLILWPTLAGWPLTKFGFSLNWRVAATTLPLLLLLALIQNFDVSWQSAFIEAFARTGEEVFFRGFLFLLLLKIFDKHAKPGVWAIIISSIVFTLIHTQTFQATYFIDRGGTGPLVFQIIQRLFNVFLFSVIFALLRRWTKSILPGAIVHSVIPGGLLALPFCLAIYAFVTVWAYSRGESVGVD